MTQPIRRESKYTSLVRDCIAQLGHATHAEIIAYCTKQYPQVSATTIHRITQRLVEDGEVALAPKTQAGDKRFDARTEPHDHFCCSSCDCLVDIDCPPACREMLQQQVCDCTIDGPIMVCGMCKECACCDKAHHSTKKNEDETHDSSSCACEDCSCEPCQCRAQANACCSAAA